MDWGGGVGTRGGRVDRSGRGGAGVVTWGLIGGKGN